MKISLEICKMRQFAKFCPTILSYHMVCTYLCTLRLNMHMLMYMQYMWEHLIYILHCPYTCVCTSYLYPVCTELLMSVGSWFLQSQFGAGHDRDSPSQRLPVNQESNNPSISTCRPMSYQEEGAKVCTLGLTYVMNQPSY